MANEIGKCVMRMALHQHEQKPGSLVALIDPSPDGDDGAEIQNGVVYDHYMTGIRAMMGAVLQMGIDGGVSEQEMKSRIMSDMFPGDDDPDNMLHPDIGITKIMRINKP